MILDWRSRWHKWIYVGSGDGLLVIYRVGADVHIELYIS
jgi:hypothetical protein